MCKNLDIHYSTNQTETLPSRSLHSHRKTQKIQERMITCRMVSSARGNVKESKRIGN